MAPPQAAPPEPGAASSRASYRVVLFLGVFLILNALGLVGVAVAGVLGSVADEELEPLTGRVTAVQVERDPARSRGREASPHLLKVSYEYEVGGKVYSGSQYSRSDAHQRFDSRVEADERAAALLSERELTLYRDPAEPSKAVIARRERGPMFPMGLLGVAVGLLGLFCVNVYTRRRRART
jgi:hypothetical protein